MRGLRDVRTECGLACTLLSNCVSCFSLYSGRLFNVTICVRLLNYMREKKLNSETRLTAVSAPKQDPNTQTVNTNASFNGTVQNIRKLPGVSGRMLA